MCKALIQLIMDDGNFGRKKGKVVSVETVSTAIRKEGLFGRLQHAGKVNWKLYRKHRWLGPVAWIYQIFRYVRQLLTSGHARHIMRDYRSGVKREEVLRRAGAVK